MQWSYIERGKSYANTSRAFLRVYITVICDLVLYMDFMEDDVRIILRHIGKDSLYQNFTKEKFDTLQICKGLQDKELNSYRDRSAIISGVTSSSLKRLITASLCPSFSRISSIAGAMIKNNDCTRVNLNNMCIHVQSDKLGLAVTSKQ